jgi:hypothetical protein
MAAMISSITECFGIGGGSMTGNSRTRAIPPDRGSPRG